VKGIGGHQERIGALARYCSEGAFEAADLLEPGEGDWRNWTIWVTDQMGRHVTSVLVKGRTEKIWFRVGS
jgi:hypothetical protein